MADEALDAEIAAAWSAYFQGRSLAARQGLATALAARAPGDFERIPLLEAMLDICLHSQADACVRDHAQAYVDALQPIAAAATEDQRAALALRGGYYFDQGRFAIRAPEVTSQILDWAPWKIDRAPSDRLELQRQVLAANIHYALGDYPAARASIDRLLALLASVQTPQEDRFIVAWALAEAISSLVAIGESDRAYGIYRAGMPAISRGLPPLSADAAFFRLSEAFLLQQQGDLKGAREALEDHIAIVRRIELEPEVRNWLLAQALTSRTAVCAAQLDMACAKEAVEQHAFTPAYRTPGRRPASYDEVTYLAARAVAAAFSGGEDPVAAAALQGPLGFTPSDDLAAEIAVYRALGAALGQPQGAGRAEGLFETGRKVVALVEATPHSGFGAWRRPDAIEQIIVALALTQADSKRAEADETVFALLQLAGRQGSTLDADAQTIFAQARDEAQRHAIHLALRLQGRRDQLERQELETLSARSAREPAGAGLASDSRMRGMLVAVSDEIARLDATLATGKIATSGANLVSLKQLQAVLKPNEAALTLTPVPGAVAYACIRRDAVQRQVLAKDLNRMLVDMRFVQLALTADHPPSDQLDAQFPAEAAVRLHDTLIRPFEGCLRPGDHILWLPGLSLTPLPISVFLERAPPKLAKGYDLAAADWLVRRHAISYPGAASVVAASRAHGRAEAASGFLGVGDPVLKAPMAPGIPDLSSLTALPETRQELEQSAQGFRNARLLLGEQATEGAVRQALATRYGFLSFATHGLVRDELKGLREPALALTPVSAARGDDGLLLASEIADLTLAARFVALSACNTANIDLSRLSGDLAALASAFAVAGAPSVLGTMWPVDSETGKQVVAATFRGLSEHPSDGAALALAEAQRAFLAASPGRAYLHPRFWAPFVLMGDGGVAVR